MQLDDLQKNWDAFAKTDPFWAILTAPDKKNGRWKPDHFFETGAAEIDTLMRFVASLNWKGGRQRALDFGCGVGRLTQALCRYFNECCGVDIAAEMLRLANVFNQHGDRCSYRLNTRNDLRLFPDGSFDFVYSNIVLQHMMPEYSANYIREFVRVLAPGGLVVFQLPSEVIKPLNRTIEGVRLSTAAFRALVKPANVVHTMAASSGTEMIVTVKNVSDFTWPQSSVRLGNHWLAESGAMVALDDARAELSGDLPPGGEEDVTIRVTAPQDPGAYRLVLDMVQEGVAWFEQHGSEAAILSIDVKPKPVDGTQSVAEPNTASMEMYGTPLENVVGIVTTSGGRFIEIKEDHSAGSDWRGYRYYITKDEDRSEPRRFYSQEYELGPAS